MGRSTAQAGSVIGVSRGVFDHYGVLMADGDVVHYTSATSDVSGDMEVRKTAAGHFMRDAASFWKVIFPTEVEMRALLSRRFDSITSLVTGVVDGDVGRILGFTGMVGRELAVGAIMKHYHLYPPREVQQRAMSRVGERKYNLAFRNCEHFAIWCATGLHASQQVDGVLRGGAALVTALLGGGLSEGLNGLLEPARCEQLGGAGLLSRSGPVPARALLGDGKAGRAVAKAGKAKPGATGGETGSGGGCR